MFFEKCARAFEERLRTHVPFRRGILEHSFGILYFSTNMDILFKLMILVLLSVAVLGRVRRQGTLEDTPVLPFSGQSRPGDESPSIEVQNENAEKGLIDNKDAEIEEVIDYVDESEPGADRDAEVEQSLANEEPDIDSAIQDGPVESVVPVEGRAFGPGESFFERPYFRKLDNGTLAKDDKKDKPWYKNHIVWIIVGVIAGIILLLVCICICVKCKK